MEISRETLTVGVDEDLCNVSDMLVGVCQGLMCDSTKGKSHCDCVLWSRDDASLIIVILQEHIIITEAADVLFLKTRTEKPVCHLTF